ncbi:MAG: phosphotransferase [Pirellulaceae bacterium]|nr:phosphotransferase [Pirellulaceae bacterium]
MLQSPPWMLKAYPLAVTSAVAMGSAGGFSGAAFWRVETSAGPFCLRRWPPEHPSPDRLRSIHSVLRHVFDVGVTQVPVPIRTRDGGTFVSDEGRLWELAPWMPGTADYHSRPTRERLAAAMRLLALFHTATATFPDRPREQRASPGLRQRLAQIDRLMAGEVGQIAAAVQRDTEVGRSSRGVQLLRAFSELAPRIRPDLAAAVDRPVTLQPCLRDVWHDHVLFSGDEATGLIDFGALRNECVVGDVARLLGSLVRDDQAAWQFGLSAYQQLRPLSTTELALLGIFHRATIVLSGMNWLHWIYIERRAFENLEQVLARLDGILEDMECLRS